MKKLIFALSLMLFVGSLAAANNMEQSNPNTDIPKVAL